MLIRTEDIKEFVWKVYLLCPTLKLSVTVKHNILHGSIRQPLFTTTKNYKAMQDLEKVRIWGTSSYRFKLSVSTVLSMCDFPTAVVEAWNAQVSILTSSWRWHLDLTHRQHRTAHYRQHTTAITSAKGKILSDLSTWQTSPKNKKNTHTKNHSQDIPSRQLHSTGIDESILCITQTTIPGYSHTRTHTHTLSLSSTTTIPILLFYFALGFFPLLTRIGTPQTQIQPAPITIYMTQCGVIASNFNYVLTSTSSICRTVPLSKSFWHHS